MNKYKRRDRRGRCAHVLRRMNRKRKVKGGQKEEDEDNDAAARYQAYQRQRYQKDYQRRQQYLTNYQHNYDNYGYYGYSKKRV